MTWHGGAGRGPVTRFLGHVAHDLGIPRRWLRPWLAVQGAALAGIVTGILAAALVTGP